MGKQQISNTDEQIQDIVGGMAGANLTYDDAADSLDVSMPPEWYGDGSDGNVTHSANTSVGVVQATDYILEAGVQITPIDKNVLIHATSSIEINGTIYAKGYGAVGGDSKSGDTSQNGDPGEGGQIGHPGGKGDNSGYGDSGGPGGENVGPTDLSYFAANATVSSDVPSTPVTYVTEFSRGGAGGGSGGYDYAANGPSGAGGNGGGVVVLCAPSVTVNGTINVEGEDGGSAGGSRSGAGGGGGGGAVFLVGKNITNSGSYQLSGGAYGGQYSGGSAGVDGSLRIIEV